MAEQKKHPHVDPDFQALFLKSAMGPRVLGMMLDNCNFFDIPVDDDQRVVQDYLKTILSWCGIGLGRSGEHLVRSMAGQKCSNALDPHLEVKVKKQGEQ